MFSAISGTNLYQKTHLIFIRNSNLTEHPIFYTVTLSDSPFLLKHSDLPNLDTVLTSHTIFADNSHSNSLHTQYIPGRTMTFTSKVATLSIKSPLSYFGHSSHLFR